MSDVVVPESWEALRAELAEGPRCVLVVGGPDVGKSTFCRWLASRWAAEGVGAWLIDADVGQSQLGPPTCIGCGPGRARGADLAGAYFVGDVSPGSCPAACLGAFASAARMATEAGAARIVIDTSGWVSGPDAVALKLAEGNILGSAHVVLIEAEGELRAFRRAWRGLPAFPVHELAPVACVVRRTVTQRRAYREAALREAFRGAVECEVDLQGLAVSGPRELETPRPALPPGLLLGLNDDRGRLICLGVLRSLDPGSGVLTCLCRPEGAAAAEVRVGRLFVNPEGTHCPATWPG